MPHLPALIPMLMVLALAFLLFGRRPPGSPPTGLSPVRGRPQKGEEASIEGRDRIS